MAVFEQNRHKIFCNWRYKRGWKYLWSY